MVCLGIPHIRKTSSLKDNILRKKLYVKTLSFTKHGTRIRLFWKSTEYFDVFTRKPTWYKLLLSKVAGLESFLEI